MKGINADKTFTRVQKSLRDANLKRVVLIAVVLGQLPQEADNARVIGAHRWPLVRLQRHCHEILGNFGRQKSSPGLRH